MFRFHLITALSALALVAGLADANAQSPTVDYAPNAQNAPLVDYDLTPSPTKPATPAATGQASPEPNDADADEPQAVEAVTEQGDTADTQAANRSTGQTKTTGTTAGSGTLRLATWGGAYAKARQAAVTKPYSKKASITVEIAVHADAEGQSGLLAQPDHSIDVIELGSQALHQACTSGRLAKIDTAWLTPSNEGASIEEDFLSGGLHECGVATFAWSSIVVANTTKFKKGRRPKKLADIFNPKRFPGKRAFFSHPRYVLELALLADGASRTEVYQLLATDEGLSRAFSKLDTLGDNIVWVEKSGDAMKRLLDGEFAFAQNYSGRAFLAQARGASLAVIWDGQVYDINYLAIPKNAQQPEASRAFLAYATAPESLAAQARRLPYGPMRTSAIRRAGTHASLGVRLDAHLPTASANMVNALALNTRFWAANEHAIAQKFASWITSRSQDTNAARGSDTIITGTTKQKKPGGSN